MALKQIYRVALVFAILTQLWSCQSQPTQSQKGDRGSGAGTRSPFVRVQSAQLMRGGEPYYFAGANIAFSAGSSGSGEWRSQLAGELDQLKALGISNVRVVLAAPGGKAGGQTTATTEAADDRLLGLDFLLAELAQREMVAVVNFGHAGAIHRPLAQQPTDSGGDHAGATQDAVQPDGDEQAQGRYRAWVGAVVGRTNRINGKAYAEDPAIMSWQLPGVLMAAEEAGHDSQLEGFNLWLSDMVAFIRSIDDNHLISASSAGAVGALEEGGTYLRAYRHSGVDYLNFHLRPQQWKWWHRGVKESSLPGATATAKAFILQHIQLAEALGLPAVIDELGIGAGADGDDRNRASLRRLYAGIYAFIEQQARLGEPVVGSNFLASAEEGGAEVVAATGERGGYVSDLPPSPQQLMSVLKIDTEMLQLIEAHAQSMNAL